MSIYFTLLYSINHKKKSPVTLAAAVLALSYHHGPGVWRSVGTHGQKTRERTMWDAKQEVEDCIKKCILDIVWS